ncbi:MAG TPA: NAD-dependent epimerase/dehydratase family protein [Polyangiaceae bacterium]
MTRSVVVTGAAGFFGRNFCEFLRAQSIDVHTLSRQGLPGLPNHVAQMDDPQALSRVFAGISPEAVLHLAGTVAGGFADCFRVNTLYAAAVLDALDLAGLGDRPVLFVGSITELGQISPRDLPVTESVPPRPMGAYGVSKLAQTELGLAAARRGRPIVIVRPSNLIGAGTPVHLAPGRFAADLSALHKAGKGHGVLTTGSLEGVRDYIDVRDACRLSWRLLENPEALGRVVNLCSGEGISMSELLNRLIAKTGLDVEIRQSGASPGVPVHVSSAALLGELAGPLGLRPLDDSLSALWAAASGTYNRAP